MKKDFCYIGFILDRSGSMQSYGVETVVDGFNKLVKEQKAGPGSAHLYFAQFDTEGYEVKYDGDIQKKAEMAAGDFVPRGGTPLRDAMCRTIIDLGKRFEGMHENERPDKVIIVTLTDGLENASREYTAVQLSDMIKTQEQQYNWQFVFLGANQDAILTGEQMGVTNIGNFASMGVSARAYRKSMAFTSSNISRYRATGQSASLNYSIDQRKEMTDEEPPVVTSQTTTTTTTSRPRRSK